MTTKASKPKTQGGRRFPVLWIAFGLIAIILVAAVALSGGTAIGSEFGTPEVIGESLPPFGGTTTNDPALGMLAPELIGQDFDGNTVEIRHDGIPKAIMFLAHWCPHCQAEVPRVQQWLDATGGVEGVELFSVATSMNSAQPNYPPSEWFAREGWTVPVIRDDQAQDALVAFGAGGFPYFVFLNGDGTVAARTAGEIEITVLQGFLSSLAATQPTG